VEPAGAARLEVGCGARVFCAQKQTVIAWCFEEEEDAGMAGLDRWALQCGPEPHTWRCISGASVSGDSPTSTPLPLCLAFEASDLLVQMSRLQFAQNESYKPPMPAVVACRVLRITCRVYCAASRPYRDDISCPSLSTQEQQRARFIAAARVNEWAAVDYIFRRLMAPPEPPSHATRAGRFPVAPAISICCSCC
jgi:hypothetical protein